jgi:regulator of replication initiation timing
VSDIRRVVDELRFYLESSEADMTQSVRDAGQQYAVACKQANQRLRRCGEFLNRNLRAEAIQLAEAEPDLLEVVATLDFPGRGSWDETVPLYDLPAAEPLLLTFAEALNEAYALQEPLKKLLDKHRYLALARAPLRKRLAVLRQLVADDQTGTWEADVGEMERARLAEIEYEARDAGKKLDGRTLQFLIDEIDANKWSDERTSAQVRKSLVQRVKDTTSTVAGAELEEIANDLAQAKGENNLERAQSLKRQWDQVERRTRRGSLLATQVEPIFDWIKRLEAEHERQRQLDQAREELSEAIDDPSCPREELETLRERAMAIEPLLPDPLGARLLTRVAEIDRRERAIRTVVSTICGAVLLAIAICVVLLLRRSMHAAESRRGADKVADMRKDGQLVEARKFVKDHGYLVATDEWIQAVKDLEKAEGDEATRQTKLQRLIGAIENAASYEDARPILDEARGTAASDAEKTRVSELDAKWMQRNRDELAGKYADIEKRFGSIRSEQAQAEGILARLVPPDALEPLLDQIGQDIADLPNSINQFDAPMAQQVEQLKQHLADLRQRTTKARKRNSLAKAIREQSSIRPAATDSDAKVDRYVELLSSYAKTSAGDSRVEEFRKVADERMIYHGICEWQALADRWVKLTPLNLEDAKKRQGECDEFAKNHKDCPACPIIERYSRFLSAIVRRYEGEGGNKADAPIAKLRDLFSGPLMQQAHVLWDSEGNAYYLKSEADFRGKPDVVLHYFIDFAGNTANRTIQVSRLKSPRSAAAPQIQLSASAIGLLDKLTIANWDHSLNGLCHQILDDHDLDPFLQYALLHYTLEYASQGSEPLEPELQKTLAFLTDSKLELSTRWMLPNDASVTAARSRAQELVAKLSRFDAPWSAAEESRQGLGRELFARFLFVGALERGKDEEWICSSCWKPDGEYELVVAMPPGEKSRAAWQVIGKGNHRGLELARRLEPGVLCEGRLVLARGAAPSNAVARRSGRSENAK